jgi:diaminohydroxyphosphoribosylaminopyrimidine deaminase / 5-amino-6-(5-phosphoribosylamino)uracil reductase
MQHWTASDEKYMRLALNLAARAFGRTWPNPMVGAVLVRGGRILGRGWHRHYGGPHGEINALRAAGGSARGATLYINLEPCSHFGKTPPCAPALVGAGIVRVVAAMRDPNPKVSGRGFAILRRAGIKVEVGLLETEARALNEVFLKRMRTGLPFVICKAAMSLDGKIACRGGEARWISGSLARRYAHRLRAVAEAVVVGAGTLRQDNPALTVRQAKPLAPGRPWRVVLEGKKSLSSRARLFRDAARQPVIIATTRTRPHPLAGKPGVEIWTLPGQAGRVNPGALLRRLGKRGVSLVLVEGGAEIHAAFLGLDRGLGAVHADRVCFIVAPIVIGGRRAPSPVGGLGADLPAHGLRVRDLNWSLLGSDLVLQGTPLRPRRPARKMPPRRKEA